MALQNSVQVGSLQISDFTAYILPHQIDETNIYSSGVDRKAPDLHFRESRASTIRSCLSR